MKSKKKFPAKKPTKKQADSVKEKINKLRKLSFALESPEWKSFHKGIEIGTKMILSTYSKSNSKSPEWKSFHEGVAGGIKMILKKVEKGGHI